MAITDLEIRMTIKTLAAKGVPKRAIARQLDLSKATIRYHLSRIASGTPDGRAAQPRRARRRVETPPGAQAQVDWGIGLQTAVLLNIGGTSQRTHG